MKKLTEEQVLDLVDGFIPITELPGRGGNGRYKDGNDKKDDTRKAISLTHDIEELESVGHVFDLYSNNITFDE